MSPKSSRLCQGGTAFAVSKAKTRRQKTRRNRYDAACIVPKK
ncbi:hypothetical protein Acin_0734 [Acidaminococcus intestini RyC-MR95]|uniref:Uncharacterized protein n=1 Tax=Acidaminococcus intestini (strain RyC-MR95) TaxID=568816 RepID=G4Q4Q6_ACIIR|nr:hypothetical protein Acin_0734 [Acidaminococcus intestini RyC-MR95]